MPRVAKRLVLAALLFGIANVTGERPLEAKISCAMGAVFILDKFPVCVPFVTPSNCEYCEVTVEGP